MAFSVSAATVLRQRLLRLLGHLADLVGDLLGLALRHLALLDQVAGEVGGLLARGLEDAEAQQERLLDDTRGIERNFALLLVGHGFLPDVSSAVGSQNVTNRGIPLRVRESCAARHEATHSIQGYQSALHTRFGDLPTAEEGATRARPRPGPRGSCRARGPGRLRSMTSGGASRRVVVCVSLTMTPRSSMPLAVVARRSGRRQQLDARPQADPADLLDRGHPAVLQPREHLLAEDAGAFLHSPVARMRSTSRPTAQASGLPPNVEPCSPGVKHAEDRRGATTAETRHDAAAERLAEAVHVGLHALVVAGERVPGAAEARTGSRRRSAGRRASVHSSRDPRR